MGVLSMVAAALLWSTFGPVARVPLAHGMSPLEIGFWRAATAAGCFAVHTAITGRWRIARRDLPGVAGFAVLGVTVFYWAYAQAVSAGGAALASVLLYTAPVWVVIGSVLWLREPVTRRGLAAVAMTLGGIGVIAFGDPASSVHPTPPALGFGLLSGVAYAAYYLWGRAWWGRYPAPTLFLYLLTIGGLLLLPAVSFAPKRGVDWLALGYLGVVPTYLAYQAYWQGVARIAAARAAAIATLEPVAAAGLALLMWGERFAAIGYLGAALVLAGVVVSARRGDG